MALKNNILQLAAVALLLTGSVNLSAAPSELQPFDFLLGEWEATGSGEPGTAGGTTVFERSLQGRVILRTNFAEYPPTADRPGSRHDDLMVIFVSPTGVRADYYDSEGHTIRYRVTSPGPGLAVFLSEPAPGGPRFRLTYKRVEADALEGEFAIAPAEAGDTFKPYLQWRARKIHNTAN